MVRKPFPNAVGGYDSWPSAGCKKNFIQYCKQEIENK
jgi:hypothetical protein